tara:strand:- start:7706 stop:8614 length:909 start_codon:yes stop_codon:yes gene_type:complete
MVNTFGGGNGKGGGSIPFGTPPGGPTVITGPPFGGGGESGFCNLYLQFGLFIHHKASPGPGKPGNVSMSLNLAVEQKCEDFATITRGALTLRTTKEGQEPKESLQEIPTNPSTTLPPGGVPTRDLCKDFNLDSIGTGDTLELDPAVLPELLKDMSVATSREARWGVPGNDLQKLIKDLCEGTGAGTIEMILQCEKPIGECTKDIGDNSNSDTCSKIIKVMLSIPGPDMSFDDLIGQFVVNVDPCAFSQLLDCWNANPDSSTSFPIPKRILQPGLTQWALDQAGKTIITGLFDKCGPYPKKKQ